MLYFVVADCTEMVNEGTGQENLLQFFYNKDRERCFPFFYKGEGGNGNRFPTELQCLGNCSSQYRELYPEGGKTFFHRVDFLFLIGQANHRFLLTAVAVVTALSKRLGAK